MLPVRLNKDVERLLRAVAELEGTARDGWVPWPRIAKKLEGSVVFTQLFKGYADLPEAKPLFSKNEKVVRLSLYGRTVYNQLPMNLPQYEPVTLQIAKAVKEYASTLRHLTFPVVSVEGGGAGRESDGSGLVHVVGGQT